MGTAGLALGLVCCLGTTTTKCSANPSVSISDGPSSERPSHVTGSVVRCPDDTSCQVILRRATTRTYAGRLHGTAAETVTAGAVAELACMLLTHRLTTHVACAVGLGFVAGKLIGSLKGAASDDACLEIDLRVPGTHGTWKPVSYSSYSGHYCAA